ncbi:cytochrome c family protein [Sphingomonas sp. ID1715]|uniref:c-type cytochrome n=1 Tax=Sphingomonas sp. ID1715 TaxID=1656898 RepID=UPI001C2BD927|nr:c-type cytochrome [Sphingomonas sp. ID1715]
MRWGSKVALAAAGCMLAAAAGYTYNYIDAQRQLATRAALLTGGDPARGWQLVQDYGCGGCHAIPDVPQAAGLVGPPLKGIAVRVYLAGRLVNTPDNMRAWIQHPHSVDPQTAMPELGVTAGQARDIAAYLYTLG